MNNNSQDFQIYSLTVYDPNSCDHHLYPDFSMTTICGSAMN